MAYEFKLPDLGEGLTEGEVARWLVEEGQDIAEDDPLVEIQTDKTTVEIPSPAAGKVARILVREGEVVPVGTVLVVIGDDAAAPDVGDGSNRSDTVAEVCHCFVRPQGAVARLRSSARIAQELGVDLAIGQPAPAPTAQITEADVRGARGRRGARRRRDGASRCAASAG